MGRSEAEPREADLGRVHEIDFHGQYAFEPTGGDLFDTVQVGSRMAFVLTDIAGRRPEIDPVLAETRKIFRASSAELLSAIDVNLMEVTEVLIHAINEALIETAKGVCFAPTMVGCYDHQLGVMAYINAGGQTALFHDSEGTRALPNASVPLGLFTHLPYDASIQAFEPGAMLLVVTKGVTESLGGMKPVASERATDVLQRCEGGSASEVCRAVLEAAQRFEKRRWEWLPFRGELVREDRTAFAMARTVSA